MTLESWSRSVPHRLKSPRTAVIRLLVVAVVTAVGAATWWGGGPRISPWFAARDATRRTPSGTELLGMIVEYHKMEAASCLDYVKSGRERAGRLTLDGLKSLGSAAWFAYRSRATPRRSGTAETPHQIQTGNDYRDFEESLTAAKEQVRSTEWSALLAQYHSRAAEYYEGLLASGATELPPPSSPALAELRRPLEEHLKREGVRVVLPIEPLPHQLLSLVPRKGDKSFVPPFTAAPPDSH